MRSPLPRPIVWLLAIAAPSSTRQSLLADLEEEVTARARRDGDRAARRWCWRQLAGSFIPLIWRRLAVVPHQAWRRTTMIFWRQLPSDLGFALRRLMHARMFALTCVLTLALGIGATTAMFTLVQQFLLTPLPVPRPAELYRFGDSDNCCVVSGLQGVHSIFSYDLYRRLRDETAESFELAAFQAGAAALTVRRPGETTAAPFHGEFVSGNFFAALGVTAHRGRLLAPGDDRPGAAPSAVVAFRTWQRRFGADPSIAGRTVTMNGVAVVIAGVAPEGFYGAMLRPNPPEIWIPIALEPVVSPETRLVSTATAHWLYIVGRLRPDVSAGAIAPRATGVLRQWLTALPDLGTRDRARIGQQEIRMVAAARGVESLRHDAAPALLMLLTISAAVLAIACTNLANLLLARGLGRRVEFAVRLALGASRGRLLVEGLTESVILSAAGGLAALAVARWGAGAIVAMVFPDAHDFPIDVSPSPAVLLFAAAVSLITVVAVGLLPALAGSRSDPIDAMRGAGRVAGARGSRARQGLVSLQVALSLALVACAGLLAATLYNLQRQDFGFRTEGRYSASVNASLGEATVEHLQPVYARLAERLAGIPGVTSAAFALYGPMEGNNWTSRVTVDGHAPGDVLSASWNRVSPRYFETLGTRLVRGRFLDARDTPRAPAAAVVSETFAARFFGTADPVGKRFGLADRNGGGSRSIEIVGVVGDAKYQDPRRPAYATFFLPFLQQPPGLPATQERAARLSNIAGSVVLRADRPVPGLESDIRRALADVDPGLTLLQVRPLDEQVAASLRPDRMIASLASGFGAVALLLACLGLYGVMTQAVAGRTREFGVRLAIGATPRRLAATVLRGALLQVGIGLALGAAGAIVIGRLLEGMLFGISGRDPRLVLASAAVLALCAGIAAVIPAIRASRIDPMRALRVD